MRQPWPHHHRRKQQQQQQRSKAQPQRKKNHRVAVLPPTYEEENPANDDNNAVVFNKGSFLPSAITESSRSEGDDDFFLHSFDDDQHSQSISNFTTRTSSLDVASTRQQLEEEDKQNRDEAMALLGGFFQLGGELEEMVVNSSSIQTVPTTIISSDGGGGDSSPRSVISLFGSSENNSSIPPRIPEEQNVFEKFITKVFSAKPSSKAKEMSPSSSSPKFAMLKKADRSMSLPVERTQYSSSSSSSTTLGPKRPSLKKISSIGNFPKSQSDASLKRSVSFGKLNIRKYNVAISDHPSCSYGPPVQLSWDFDKSKEEEIPLESYEQARQPRRQPNDLVLSYYDRRYLLIKQGGYSKREVKEAVKEVERVKRERMVTDLFLPASPIEETIGSVVDSVRGIFAAPNDDDDQRSQHLEAYVMPQFHSL